MDERIFYGLLERVGGNGRYQTVALCAWSAIMMIIGSTNFFLPYVYYQGNYQCPAQYINCKEFVCSLPANQRTQYINDDPFSLASKFGDYRCEDNVELDRIQSFIYLGGVVGVMIGAFTNEIITKRALLIIAVMASIAGLVIALLGQTLLVASIGLFLNSAATAIQMEMLQCIIVETVSEDVRGQHSIVTYIFYSVGVTLNGLFFYLLKSWQVYLLILVPILLAVLLLLIFYIEETPFDIIVYSTPENALKSLKKISEANDRAKCHKISLPELQNIKSYFESNEEKKQHSNISILDLFRYGSLRTLMIASLFLHYATSFQFSAPEMAIRNYSLNIYTNGVVIGAAELAGSILCYFLIDHHERKKVIYITQTACIAISIFVFFFLSCSDKDCSIETQIMQTLGLTIFRFAATFAYNFFYVMQYEAFPNQIRGLAIQVVCIPSNLASVTTPQIITLCESSGVSIVFAFVLASIMIGAVTMCLSQTFGIPPPQMIEELKYEHHTLQDPSILENIKET